jgi:hypothetical protein
MPTTYWLEHYGAMATPYRGISDPKIIGRLQKRLEFSQRLLAFLPDDEHTPLWYTISNLTNRVACLAGGGSRAV